MDLKSLDFKSINFKFKSKSKSKFKFPNATLYFLIEIQTPIALFGN